MRSISYAHLETEKYIDRSRVAGLRGAGAGEKRAYRGVISQIEVLLARHELIKIKFLDFKDEKRRISEEIAARTHAELVRVIGNNAILYKQNPDSEKGRVVLQ